MGNSHNFGEASIGGPFGQHVQWRHQMEMLLIRVKVGRSGELVLLRLHVAPIKVCKAVAQGYKTLFAQALKHASALDSHGKCSYIQSACYIANRVRRLINDHQADVS